MNRRVKHPDVVKLVSVSANGYGDKTVTTVAEVNATFLQGTTNSRSENQDIAGADAHVYLDIDNPELVSRGYKIEGMYLVADLFGSPTNSNWYRISTVRVGQRKLLTNEVNNVHAFLRRVAEVSDAV